MKKKIIIGAIVIILVIIIISLINKKEETPQNEQANLPVEEKVYEEFVEVLEDGTKLNISEELNKEKYLGELSFNNIQLTNAKGQSVLLADVTNTGTDESSLKTVDIIILDKNLEEIGRVGGIIVPLQPGQSTQFNSGTQSDYANAYDFKIVETQN